MLFAPLHAGCTLRPAGDTNVCTGTIDNDLCLPSSTDQALPQDQCIVLGDKYYVEASAVAQCRGMVYHRIHATAQLRVASRSGRQGGSAGAACGAAAFGRAHCASMRLPVVQGCVLYNAIYYYPVMAGESAGRIGNDPPAQAQQQAAVRGAHAAERRETAATL